MLTSLVFHYLSVTEISEKLRYKNESYLIAQFKKFTGLSPTSFKEIERGTHERPSKNIKEHRFGVKEMSFFATDLAIHNNPEIGMGRRVGRLSVQCDSESDIKSFYFGGNYIELEDFLRTFLYNTESGFFNLLIQSTEEDKNLDGFR